MTKRVFPGGWYPAALPAGEFCVLYPGSHVQTNVKTVAFPEGETYGPMFLDIAPGRFCGLAHDQPGVILEYDFAGWREDRTTFRHGRVVYDQQGRILDTLPAGYQFVGDDGVPVERTVTYSPRHGLSEWTETGGLIIGQGHDSIAPPGAGGVLVWDGQQHRKLDDGDCKFIRVHRDGEQVAIAYVKSGAGAVIWWATLAELRDLPLHTAPVPSPTPVEPPKETMRLPQDVFATYAAVVAKFPHTGDDENRVRQHHKAVATVRARHGLQWATKSEHSNLAPSTDALTFVPAGAIHGERQDQFIWDMINGSTREVNRVGESEALRKAFTIAPEPKDWLKDDQPDEPEVPDDDDPELPDVDDGGLLDLLKQELETVIQTAVADLRKDIAALRQELKTIEFEGKNRFLGTITFKRKGDGKTE